MTSLFRKSRALLLALGMLGSLALPALAQASGPPPSMRAFTHVFIAYAVAWILLLFWVVRIASRLRRLHDPKA